MSRYTWATTFHQLFQRCSAAYADGNTDFSTWFDESELGFLSAIGYKPQEFFDFVEDSVHAGPEGEPTVDTALLVAAVRRDFFRVVMKGQWSDRVVDPSDLPAKNSELEGYVWLPRILAKARAKLRGEMDPDTMFGCGGDRAFLSQHDVHPADFLRLVWAAGDNDEVVVRYLNELKQED